MDNIIQESSEKIENIDKRLRIPLHYINEQFLDDTNENTSFLCIGF